MRIDYSEPKKSYVSPQGGSRPRKESSGSFTLIIVITGVVTFAAGFGTGWFLSQKSAKKSFQAATEQTSLENSPKKETPVAPKNPQPVPQPPATQQQPESGATPPSTAVGATADPPLSFYKSLPSGQKNNVLGSGINAKEDHAKQPLQAPLPANLTKPVPADAMKPTTEKPAGADKPAGKQADGNSFTVQVASFPLKSEAEASRSKLAAKGYHVYVVESNQGEKGIWYRVRVGKKLDHDAAKELSAKLGKTAMVIPDKE